MKDWKANFLRWLLKHFYKVWAVCYNSKHSYMAGIYVDKPHSLIYNCEVVEAVYGIYITNGQHNLFNNIIIDSYDTAITLGDKAKLEATQ
jgi:hypothetical protein